MLTDETLANLAALPESFNLHRLAKELIWRRAAMERLSRWADGLDGSDEPISGDRVAKELRERMAK